LGLYDLLLLGVAPDLLGLAFFYIPGSWVNMDIVHGTFAPEGSPNPLLMAAPAILQIAAFLKQTPYWRSTSSNTSGYMVSFLHSCSSCCFGIPLLTGPNISHNEDTSLLRVWLVEHPEEQERLRHCMTQQRFSLVTWGGLVSLVVGLQHKVKGKSRLLGCQVPCAAAAAAAAAASAAQSLAAGSAADDGAESSLSQLVCVGYTAAPEVLTYSTSALENSLVSCLFYSYMLEPLDRLLRFTLQLPSKGEHASNKGSSSSCGTISDGCSSGGSNTNHSSTTGSNGTRGADKGNSSSSSSAGRASQQAEPSAAVVPATPSTAGNVVPGKGHVQGSRGLKRGFLSPASTAASTAVDASRGLKKGFFAPKANVQEKLDFDMPPTFPVVGQQHVDWLFAPSKEDLDNTSVAARLAHNRDPVGALEAVRTAVRIGEVGAGIEAAGPVAPTAQHLGLVLELLPLAWPNNGSAGRLHRTETQQQDQQAMGKEEGWDKGREPEQGGQGERLQEQQQQQDEQADPSTDELNWQRAVDWLLLLGALLQQATAAERQRFMLEQGTLLLQLLYHLLLDDPMLDGEGEVHGLRFEGPWGRTLAGGRAACKDLSTGAYYTVSKLVLLVLQTVVYEPVRWSPARGEALIGQARMLYSNAGGFGSASSVLLEGETQKHLFFGDSAVRHPACVCT
jgi:hypothetical protein